jgi:hypothetical protein
MNSLRKSAEEYDLELILADTETVYLPDSTTPVRGYFSNEPLTLAVGMDTSLENWLPVSLHESCHFDQWKEKDPTFTKSYVNGEDSLYLLFRWVDGEDIPADDLRLAFELTKECELNCERRVVKKIKEFELPIDVDEYCKRASAHIHYYNYMAIRRVKYGGSYAPYYDRRILKLMPTNLRGAYKRLPPNVLPAYDTFFSEKFLNDRVKNIILLKDTKRMD